MFSLTFGKCVLELIMKTFYKEIASVANMEKYRKSSKVIALWVNIVLR
ncbi:hypothetical protein bcere0026_22170 [Bacillus mycoides]|uniref:Uncharacterized protein n=1 Tax=Bacillus mycoides TaxID=1405 RepID=C2XU46_BACMY|nr:hypothetical protein bcere0026_22170 [Bacillus mycoides]